MSNEHTSAEVGWDVVRQVLQNLPTKLGPKVDIFLMLPRTYYRLTGYVKEIGMWLPVTGLGSVAGVLLEVHANSDELDDRIAELVADGWSVGLIYEKGDAIDVRYVRSGGLSS